MTHPSEAELIEALKEAESALSSCYNVLSYPANGTSTQDDALYSVRDVLARALTRAEGGKRWRHKKRGTEYTLLGIGKMQAEGWFQLLGKEPADACVDMREVAIYRSDDDGSLWVRPREEFEDGRFEALTAPSQPASDGPFGYLYQPKGGSPKWAFAPEPPEGDQWNVKAVYADDNADELKGARDALKKATARIAKLEVEKADLVDKVLIYAHRAEQAALSPYEGKAEPVASLAEWCEAERAKLGAVDGYDYRSGEEFGLRRAQIEAERRAMHQPAQPASDEGGKPVAYDDEISPEHVARIDALVQSEFGPEWKVVESEDAGKDAELVRRLREAHENSPQRIVGSDIFLRAADRLEALSAGRPE